MQNYIERGALKIDAQLDAFISNEAIVGTGVDLQAFWAGFEKLLAELMPQNQALLEKRESLQSKIDDFNRENPNYSMDEYKAFLTDIGYLVQSPPPFSISTAHVDEEIANMAGPQLVVPINNARYAVNAANARWGSLYDAVYGTDVIDDANGAEKGNGYNPVRGQKVIEFARNWLDIIAPLSEGSHIDVIGYRLQDGRLICDLDDKQSTGLEDTSQFTGYSGDLDSPDCILLVHNGLHIELQFDDSHPVGKTDPTGMKDILVEAALSTIMDCEDSVAAVDAQDKVLVYRNWLGLMKGDLSCAVSKNGKSFERSLAADRHYLDASGNEFSLKGRSLMFVRNVGHLMTSDAILFKNQMIPEGIMDGVVTSLIGIHDIKTDRQTKNSRHGSIYIVKPKMHGPEEVAFANTLFARIESLLGLPAYTLKMGTMDEERRTSVNLGACIYEAKERTAFINTGFLDRTGDEIHTAMQLGPFALKGELKSMPWIQAYEKDNVSHGLQAGLSGKAQIGKGMWPIPDNMADMMKAKIQHPLAGANTAWVPSPTAATLHALHYHKVNVFEQQKELAQQPSGLDDILTVPLMDPQNKPDLETITNELDNNVQGILGYVVRWVNQGIGCSKVPDINNVGLMEDRATLRISSQHIANWLLHGLISSEQVLESMERMARLVDQQNANDADYIPMGPTLSESIAFDAAKALVFEGTSQPSGYTEPLLHAMRRKMKQFLASQ
ncbi:malate synthase G [Aliiglaciecola sp. M165]|uniref:malate synthase G n=1 Tax=Aliiglaciecola sp. M165 TaxID=2593649 RepID=UPI00117F8FAE|nr:malate synthase G [Aliiglaciecola sp. M165]TRY29559.1 malate synthase G [Aliiglaciecola sp. M165]